MRLRIRFTLLSLGLALIGACYFVDLSTVAWARERELTWLKLQQGLQEVREKKRPAIVWYTGKATQDEPHFFTEFLQSRWFHRMADKFVLIRLDSAVLSTPYPGAPAVKPRRAGEPPVVPTVALHLRLLDDPASFLLLDFRERVVRRYEPQKTPPKRTKLAAELSRVVAIGAKQLKNVRRVEQILASAARAKAAKKIREAVLKLRPLDSQEERDRLDPVLREKVEKVVQQYRQDAAKLFQRAHALMLAGKQNPKESGKKFSDALAVYDRLARDYPFRDIHERANIEKGVVITWLNLGGGLR